MAFITPLTITRTSHTRRQICARQAPQAAVAPLSDRVLVKVDAAKEESTTGLYIGKEQSDKPSTGTVVAVAPGRYSPEGTLQPLDLKVGDHVLWKDDYGSETVQHEQEGELLALKIYSIAAKW